MASILAKLWTKLRSKQTPPCIMIVGLDNSGKTSILNTLAILNQDGSCGPKPVSNYQRIPTSASRPNSPSNESLGDGRTMSVEQQNNKTNGSDNIMPTVGYNYERIQYKQTPLTVLDFSGQNKYRNLWQEFYNGVDAIVFVIDSSDTIRLVVVRDELEIMLNHPYFASLSMTRDEYEELHQSEILLPSLAALHDNLVTVQKQITISQGKLITSPLNASISSNTANSNNQRPTRRSKVPILFLANKSDLVSSVDTQVIIKALNLNQLPAGRHPWLIQATSVNLNQGIVEAFDWLVNQLSLN